MPRWPSCRVPLVRRRPPGRARLLGAAAVLAAVAIAASACGGAAAVPNPPHAGGDETAGHGTTPTQPSVQQTARDSNANHRMFAFYYLWWDTQHWHARLGPNYPYSASPLPLPATLSGNGCTVTNNYPGNQLTDVAPALWSQSDASQIRTDVTEAAQTGLAGFAVSWAGTGMPHQTASSSAFNRRLAMVVDAVHQVNQAGGHFSLWIAYISSARIRTESQIDNDLTYLHDTYGNDPAFDRSNSSRPTLIMMGSRKYPQSQLDEFSHKWRHDFYLVGDENWTTWNSAKAADFDADQYYWSSQNPLTNKASFADISQLAAEVRSSRNPNGSAKQFFSPLAPGYNKVLGGGSGCVPRDGGQTMKDIFAGNSAAHPDGWTVISWNEIDEGTYIVPLERYGTQSLSTLSSIIHGPSSGGGS